VKWWSEELSNTQYDGIIGLSQGAAMVALLVSMVSTIPNGQAYEWFRILQNGIDGNFINVAQKSRNDQRIPSCQGAAY
jgi:hypothetical protein